MRTKEEFEVGTKIRVKRKKVRRNIRDIFDKYIGEKGIILEIMPQWSFLCKTNYKVELEKSKTRIFLRKNEMENI